MYDYYGCYSSLPDTPTIPPPTSAPHYYHPQLVAYLPPLHQQLSLPIPYPPTTTLATVITIPLNYQPAPPTLTPYPPPTPPTPSITHCQLPEPPTVAPPPLTPTHEEAWEAKRAAQHSELMHLLRLRFGIPEPQPPPPASTLPPTSPSQTLTSPPPPPATLPAPPLSAVASKPTPAAATTTLPPTRHSPPLSKPPLLPATVHPPSPLPRPPTTTPHAHSPVIASKLLFDEFGVSMPIANRPSLFLGTYDIPLFEEGPAGYRIWNPGGKHALEDLVVSFPHLEDKVNFSGAGNDTNHNNKSLGG